MANATKICLLLILMVKFGLVYYLVFCIYPTMWATKDSSGTWAYC